jgi:hypothetical protein
MAPTFIANANSASANGVTSLSAAYTPTGNTVGNFLVSVFRLPFGSGATYTVFDSQGNNWVNYVNFAQSSDRYQLWYAPGCKGGGNTVTIQTVPQVSSFFRMIIAEYSGIVPQSQASITDGQTSAIGTSSTWNSGSLATANATDLLIGFTANQDSDTANPTVTSAGWTTRRTQDSNLLLADMDTSSAGSFSIIGTDGSSVHWGAGIAAFKAAAFAYSGYGINDCGGVALPAQEPSSTAFAAQTNSTNQLTPGSGRGPTNVGVFYQSGGGGTTPGDGQIFPTGRS